MMSLLGSLSYPSEGSSALLQYFLHTQRTHNTSVDTFGTVFIECRAVLGASCAVNKISKQKLDMHRYFPSVPQ